ncbi:MAG: oxidoreductase domain [Prolixibacteraceae bacterium]|nr:MAG: oxidoreductase domain [Prolixibacteraceae bacterium]
MVQGIKTGMKTIKVGVAGLGFIGPAHIEALRRLPCIEVVAISETSEELAKSKAEQLGVPEFCDNFNDLLRKDIDCVHICTPNFLHYEMAKSALLGRGTVKTG